MRDSVLNESALLKPLKQHLGSSLRINSQLSFRLCLLLLLSLQHSYCLWFLGIVMAVWCLFEWSWKVRVNIREAVHWKNVEVDSVQPACEGAMSCDLITLWWTCSCCDAMKLKLQENLVWVLGVRALVLSETEWTEGSECDPVTV